MAGEVEGIRAFIRQLLDDVEAPTDEADHRIVRSVEPVPVSLRPLVARERERLSLIDDHDVRHVVPHGQLIRCGGASHPGAADDDLRVCHPALPYGPGRSAYARVQMSTTPQEEWRLEYSIGTWAPEYTSMISMFSGCTSVLSMPTLLSTGKPSMMSPAGQWRGVNMPVVAPAGAGTCTPPPPLSGWGTGGNGTRPPSGLGESVRRGPPRSSTIITPFSSGR